MLLLRLLSRCPLWFLHGLGAAVGWLSWALSPSYRRRIREHRALAGLHGWAGMGAVGQAGRMIAELPWLWLRAADRPLGARVRWEGEEHILAVPPGQGLIFLTPHMGCFEVTAQAYAEQFAASHGAITVLYRPARKPWMRKIVAASRQRPNLDTAPATLSGVRQLLRALRQGQAVGLLPDQVPPQGQGVWAPFFGRPAYTMTLAQRLALQTGAAVVLVWGERLSWGRGYVVHARPGPQIPADSSPECAAELINQSMQALILEAPDQYLWGYNRYKSPREGGLA
ncbi:lysophospholipid acyltransferase family protein [Pelomonas sp. APW6]|uniref:Lysophospholipid acyltransferase family protein n=1 Tax=Roseateles subflavus TaxID=3053353 RepID=A0ABT7LJP4_9BURK|nr:lysophospholipid acyltransferase family protein [Pelomonas sp. APW6]MDL5032502.1 lysophospholipid acyltransferase family protein [Pelomonas sp. APW6]